MFSTESRILWGSVMIIALVVAAIVGGRIAYEQLGISTQETEDNATPTVNAGADQKKPALMLSDPAIQVPEPTGACPHESITGAGRTLYRQCFCNNINYPGIDRAISQRYGNIGFRATTIGQASSSDGTKYYQCGVVFTWVQKPMSFRSCIDTRQSFLDAMNRHAWFASLPKEVQLTCGDYTHMERCIRTKEIWACNAAQKDAYRLGHAEATAYFKALKCEDAQSDPVAQWHKAFDCEGLLTHAKKMCRSDDTGRSTIWACDAIAQYMRDTKGSSYALQWREYTCEKREKADLERSKRCKPFLE